MTHMGKGVLTYEKARLAVIDGLEDDDTHMGKCSVVVNSYTSSHNNL